MSNTNPGNASPYELRERIVSQLLQMAPTERKSIEADLNQISTIASSLDKIISGKPLEPAAVVAPSLVDKFREFVSEQTVWHPQHGDVQVEWKPWYKREFERLTAPKEGPTIFQEISFSRQSGMTTFLILYSTFMAIHRGRRIILLASGPSGRNHIAERVRAIYSKVTATANGSVQVVTGLNEVRGNLYDQVIGDNSPLEFTSGSRLTETINTLLPGRSDVDTPWVLYHTVE